MFYQGFDKRLAQTGRRRVDNMNRASSAAERR